MRILGIGDYGDLGDLYFRLLERGHEVRMAVAEAAYADVFRGRVVHTADWQADLDWVRAAGRDGLIIFETAHHGKVQDDLRAAGFNVIGGCAFGDRLENDRSFGQEAMRQGGMRTAPERHFNDAGTAIDYIRKRPRRYVCKHNGHHLPSTRNHVGALEDGADVIALLEHLAREVTTAAGLNFILMDYVTGVETGVGAYFNGRRFIGPVCLDWEHKRFFPGDLGELTGEMGTLVSYRGGDRLFAETLAPLAPLLAQHGYQGYINMNTIINDDGVWPLEFTCRFGYPGFAILDCLHVHGWEGILRALVDPESGGEHDLEAGALATHPGYAVGVVMTVPPFPYAAEPHPSHGLPISFRPGLTAEEFDHLHYGEVDFSSGSPHIGGGSGYVLVATGRGVDATLARRAAYRLVDHLVIPNVRYRTDIGSRFIAHEEATLQRLGYLPRGPVASSLR